MKECQEKGGDDGTMTTVSEFITLDLTIEILLRLPAISLFRFRCVSKTWFSIIRSQKFVDAYMSMSPSRPRLLLSFNYRKDNRLLSFSLPQSFSFSSSSSVVASKNCTLTVPKVRSDDHSAQCNSVRGFICYRCCSNQIRFVVCNPSTGQVINLPEKPSIADESYMYLGYDPINDQFKVLRLEMKVCSDIAIGHSVCTLGVRKPYYFWRRIKSSIPYYRSTYSGVCIDGVVYFVACLEPWSRYITVSSFDVESEQLRLVKTPEGMLGFLTNYLGKLAAYDSSNGDGFILWVLDDVKNQVWSKRICVFPSFTTSLFWDLRLHFAGMTAAGEIVYLPNWFSDPYEILCYHVEKKVERRVRVEGLKGVINDGVCSSCASVSCCFVDNVIYL